MRQIKQTVMAIAFVLGIGFLAVPQTAAAINLFPKGCEGQTSEVCKSVKEDNAESTVVKIINTILVILGIVAVIMIIVGGFRYVLSGGDASNVTAAKNTIMYAVIGLIVAVLAYAIVNFVLNSLQVK